MNFNWSTRIFIHSLFHYEAEKTISSSAYLSSYLFKKNYEWQVFSEFCIKTLNGCILDIYFDFPHNFKAKNTLQAYEINLKRAKIFNFSSKMSLFTNWCTILGWKQHDFKILLSFPNRAIKHNYCIQFTEA